MDHKAFNAMGFSDSVPSELFRSVIEPQLREAMPVLVRRTASIVHPLGTPADVLVIDGRSWELNDLEFGHYVEAVASQSPTRVVPFEDPFGTERPWKVDRKYFARKLDERSRIVSTTFDKSQLMSPCIRWNHDDDRAMYEAFMKATSRFWGAYAIDLCNSHEEPVIAYVSTLLLRLMEVDPKPVFVVNFAIPSTADGDAAPHIVDHTRAATRLRKAMATIGGLCTKGIVWCYTGLDTDSCPLYSQPDPMGRWSAGRRTPAVHIPSDRTGWEHYLGMASNRLRIKHSLLAAVIEAGRELNG